MVKDSLLYETAFTLVDIGAAGGAAGRWEPFKNLTVVGFEPFEEEFKRLEQSPRRRWFPTTLHEKDGAFDLNITSWPTNISFLEPNFDLIRRLSLRPEDFEVKRKVPVSCMTLDKVCAENGIAPDAIKVDTQGSESSILRGARSVLSDSVFAVEVEVEFIPIYKNQPLFTDVHQCLAPMGFQLLDYGNMVHLRGRNALAVGGIKSNLVSADALYFKEPGRVAEDVRNGKRISLAAIAAICEAYGYRDFGVEVTRVVAETCPSFAADARRLESLLTATTFKERLRQRLGPLHWSRELRLRVIKPLEWLLQPPRPAEWTNELGNPRDWPLLP